MRDYKHHRPTLASGQTKNRRLVIIALILLGLGILVPTLLSKLFTTTPKHTATQTLPLPEPIVTKTADTEDVIIEVILDDNIEHVLDITIKPGDSLAKIFQQHELNTALIPKILAIDSDTQQLRHIKPGQRLLLSVSPGHQLTQIVYTLNKTENLIIHLDGDDYSTEKERQALEARSRFAMGTVNHSLYLAAKKAGLSEKIIQQLSGIFAWNIDYAKELRVGDSFVVVYEDYYAGDEKIETGDIVAAKFINQGEVYTAIRHTDDDGRDHYFTVQGESLRKAFLRHPVKFSHISSQFNPKRLHPVLKVTRPHNGVDFAAPIGTPIKAAGDGRIDFIGTNGGYGEMIKIRHNADYTTLYAHMVRFAKDLKKGDKVKQGQTIGYVGQSGLATGPHLHYEFHRKGKTVNPITVDLPSADPIANELRDTFLVLAEQMMAQLELYETAQLADAR